MAIKLGYYAFDNLTTGVTYIGMVTDVGDKEITLTDTLTIPTRTIADVVRPTSGESYGQVARRFLQQKSDGNELGRDIILCGLENLAVHELPAN